MLDLIQQVKNIYQSFADGKADKALLADLEWHEMQGGPYGGVYVGFDAIAENVFANFGKDWAQFDFVPERFLRDGEHVIVIGDYHLKRPQETESYRARVVHHWQFKENRPIYWEQFADTALFQLNNH